MSLLKYSDCQESGVSWIGNVPKSWSISPLKYLADFVNGCVFKPDSWSESGVPIIRIENLNGSLNFNFFDGSIDERHHVGEGDLLFGWSGNRGTSFGPFLWKMPGNFFLNQHIFKVRPLHGDSKWLYWCLKAVTAHVEDQATGIIGMVHVTKGDLGAIKAPVPSLHEQVAIATFLDRETAKIDALIAEQEKLIALLAEKRQATISRAVTRGLDPNVPLKDSGVPWLGKVPAHWEVGAVKRFLQSLDSKRIPLSAEERGGRQGDYPYYGASGIIDYVDDFIFDEDLILVSEDGANLLNRSMPISFVARGEYWVNNHAHILKPMCANVDYWAERIEAIDLEPFVTGSAQPKLTIDALMNLMIAVPSDHNERRDIVKFVNAAKEKIDSLASEAERAVFLLKERRAALISAAVTGKIDVRGLAA